MDVDNIKPHDILLYKGSDLTSKLIQWGTKSPYNHVAVVLDPKDFLAIESNVGHQSGVKAVDLRKLDGSIVDIFRVKPGLTYDRDQLVSFLVDCLGSKYDYAGVLWLGILKLLSFITAFSWKPFNTFQKSKDYFCSELCYEAFSSAGLDIVPDIDAAAITAPGDIAQSSVLQKVNR